MAAPCRTRRSGAAGHQRSQAQAARPWPWSNAMPKPARQLRSQAQAHPAAGDLTLALTQLRNALLYVQRALATAGLVAPRTVGREPETDDETNHLGDDPATCCAAAVSWRAGPGSGGTLERRAQSLSHADRASSAARQIESSGVAAARERRDNARLMHREARASIAAGDLAAWPAAGPGGARDDERRAAGAPRAGHRREGQARFRGATGQHPRLLAAQQRITQEKSAPPEAVTSTRRIEADLARPKRWRLPGAMTRLGRCSTAPTSRARVSIESMRRGDTLVRSLHFATKREEYDYELDRNDTHRMLITVLLAERKDAAGAMPATMQPFIDRAGQLRRDADALAPQRRPCRGIRLLEDSHARAGARHPCRRHLHPRMTWTHDTRTRLDPGRTGIRPPLALAQTRVAAAGQGRRARPAQSPALALLQQPAEALARCHATAPATRCDWVLRWTSGLIQPRSSLRARTEGARKRTHHREVRLDAGGEVPAPPAHAVAGLQQLPRPAVQGPGRSQPVQHGGHPQWRAVWCVPRRGGLSADRVQPLPQRAQRVAAATGHAMPAVTRPLCPRRWPR
jgi:hypothetical protein